MVFVEAAKLRAGVGSIGGSLRLLRNFLADFRAHRVRIRQIGIVSAGIHRRQKGEERLTGIQSNFGSRGRSRYTWAVGGRILRQARRSRDPAENGKTQKK